AGQDLIAPGAGNDLIDGGAGRDILALTGAFTHYAIEELTAHTRTTPGTYRLTDLRAGSPQGINILSGIEMLRFELGGEITLATMLNRAPTAIELDRVGENGPVVSEIAPEGAVVARLRAIDPDPEDRLTLSFAPGGDAGGRFIIDGDVLRVARADAFDFARAQSHQLTIVATDEAGNQFTRTITVAVEDHVSQFAELDLSLPPGAGSVSLWDLAGGGFVVTWLVSNGRFDHRLYSRQVNESGQALGPDVQLMLWTNPSFFQPPFLGVDDQGVAAFLFDGSQDRTDSVSFEEGSRTITTRITSHSEIRWIDTADGSQLGTHRLEDLYESTSIRGDQTGEINISSRGFASGFDSTLIGYVDGAILFSVTTFATSSAVLSRNQSTTISENDPYINVSRGSAFESFSDFGTVELYAIRFGAKRELLDTAQSVMTELRTSSSFQRFTYDNSTGTFDYDTRTQSNAQVHEQTIAFEAAPLGGAFGLQGNGITVFLRESLYDRTTANTYDNGIEIIANVVNEQDSWFLIGPGGRLAIPAVEGADPYFSAPVRAGLMLNADHAAVISLIAELDYAVSAYDFTVYEHVLRVFEGQREVARIVLGQSGALKDLFAFRIDALGDDAYLVTFRASRTTGGEVSVAQVFGLTGNAITEPMVFDGFHRFVATDSGQVIAFKTSVAPDGTTALDGSTLVRDIAVVPQDGEFADSDGDGDLDYAGTIIIGSLNGTPNVLRLEGGSYELTATALKVSGATVYANIGTNTVTPLFKGSFTLDRATGVASNFVTVPLPAGVDAYRMAGLAVTYKGLVLRDDAAVFTASFAVTQGLFGLTSIALSGPNALEINQHGPEIGGSEITIPNGKFGLSTPGDWLGINLFEATAKDVKIRYDAGIDEFRISGELVVKSDIIEVLGGLAGFDDAKLTFKNFAIKDGKYDFEGEMSAKKWSLGAFTLKDVKFGIKVDDDVVVQIDVAAGLGLPFKQLNGISFAGQLLNPPLTVNKLSLTAETSIPLPKGFFLDSINATLDHMAGSPPEPVPIPTTLSGTLGIGWGPKVPEIILPEYLGIDPIKEARIVNIKLGVSTDVTSMIAATGTINIYNDALARHSGSITWDWQKNTLTFAGGLDYFSGLITGTATARISELGLTESGTVTLGIPNAPVFSFLAGMQIASANIFVQFLADEDLTNDLIAAWSTVTIPVIGSMTVGWKYDLNTFQPSLITGANDLPKTNSFDVGGTEPWLMIAAAWENDASGEVLTRVRTPEGTFIAEADYAANGITVIAEFTGSRTKTIVIENPRAGNWDLQVIDPAGLGAVSYKGFTPNPPVGIEITAASAGVGEAQGEITATLTGADPGTKVTFWADDDMAGLDGFALASATVDADGSVSVSFPTTLLSGGTWFVYAVADDGMGAPAHHYFASPITVAHAPEGLLVEPWTPPLAPANQARVEQTALPGTVVADLSVETPDLAETHSFTLLDDAGGRFVIDGTRLLVGTGAPLDAVTGSYVLSVRIASAAGLSFDTTLTVEVAPGDPGHVVRTGTAGLLQVLLGNERAEAFHAIEPGETIAGSGGTDGLWLAGRRADYAVIYDGDGSL
ncbi:MAG TPA: hypothetical protein PKE25_04475, partial [Novosphingobium sp.]|nr:hypothetical protein [Novosphingobium sp.]